MQKEPLVPPATAKPYDEAKDPVLDIAKRSVVSGTECTGLIQSEITMESQVDSYQEIYDIPLKKDGASVYHNHHSDDGEDKDGLFSK